jgi:hypothetical protein
MVEPIKYGDLCLEHNLNAIQFCLKEGTFNCIECMGENHQLHPYLTQKKILNIGTTSTNINFLENSKMALIQISEECAKYQSYLSTQINIIDKKIQESQAFQMNKEVSDLYFQKISSGIPNSFLVNQIMSLIQSFKDDISDFQKSLEIFLEKSKEVLRNAEKYICEIAGSEFQGEIVHFAERNSNVIFIIDPKNEKAMTKVTLGNGKFFNSCETISANRRIFSIGGYDNSKSLNCFLEALLKPENKFIQRRQMLSNRRLFGVCYDKKEIIYIAGGYNESEDIADCECYQLKKDE